MINMKKVFTVCVFLLLVSVLFCACVSSNSADASSNDLGKATATASEATDGVNGTTAYPPMTADPNYVPETQTESQYDMPLPPSERTDWNVEIKFLKVDDFGIWITIYDYDNLGLWFDDYDYILERYEDDTWVQLTKKNGSYYADDPCYTLPDDTLSYISTNCVSPFSLLSSDVTFSAGHYRLTKVLSGKEFSVEFDYTP